MDSGGPSLTERVVRSVAREKGKDPLELPTLYSALNGESVEELVQELDDGQELVFTYVGMRVTITSKENVEITDDTGVTTGNVVELSKNMGD